MTRPLSGLDVMVVGGGAFGLTTALFAARGGANVSVHTANPLQASASAAAAGMLSPVFESLEAGADARLFQILTAALRAWDGLGDLQPQVAGALYVGADAPIMARTLAEWSVDCDLLTNPQARRLRPELRSSDSPALFTSLEARVSPALHLQALVDAVRAEGGVIHASQAPIEADNDWRGQADAVVIAAGFGARRWSAIAPALAHLTPIKGHILHFEGGPSKGPTLRGCEGYVAPHPSGAVFGASMQHDRADLEVEPLVVADLLAKAARLAPELVERPFVARTGVRAATPDHLPMAGRLDDGLFVATGARRNGWLLAPLVAETVVAALTGETSPHLAAFNPLRFG